MKELSVLLVEDNEDDRFLTIRALRKLPYNISVEIARNGDEALKMLQLAGKESPPDLPSFVLLDLQMPKVGGLHLLGCLREEFKPDELPVIILSSSDNPADLVACQEMGISGYLSKPLDHKLLKEQLMLASLA
jgi:two-component system response regulator